MHTRRMVAALAAMLLASACGSGPEPSPSADSDATIGVIGPKTGPAPQFYQDTQRGIELAAPIIEKRYGLELDFVYADDAGSPEGASSAVQKLLNEDDVDAIFGPPTSAPALQIAEVVARSRRPYLLVSASNADLVPTGGDKNFAFRTQWSGPVLNEVNSQVVFSDVDGKKPVVGIAYAADAFGQAAVAQYRKLGDELGVKVVEESMQTGATDFTAGAKRLRDAGVNSVFLNFTSGSDIATVTRDMKVVRFDPPRKTTTSNILANYRELSKPAEWEGLKFVEREDLNSPNFTKVLDAYRSAYGEEPQLPTVVYNVFSALDAYAQGLKAGGADHGAVRDAIESVASVEVEGTTYEKPFAPGDGEFYDADVANWHVMGFDDTPEGDIVTFGTVADCIKRGC
ncbi:ABC transporter substrate-binding protein [Nocardia zapadnayensis]|uniref:ABC transporter substrate-binding protein n=1 Tax=Nocardia rhamnosiphila TaxID=426716 RepID=UPI0022485F14|nr:ABC transporter substrate-binding protein [Nocardia zapadnayensis]MCX0275222.1 ABC transporter substrate-binding protein [Nocardia zapadnayensis]